MYSIKNILNKLLYPPKILLALVSAVSFTALVLVFFCNKNETLLAYAVYTASAYSLTALVARFPEFFNAVKTRTENSKMIKHITSTEIGNKYINDLAFRGKVSIYQALAVDFFYTLFRGLTGIYYKSVWSISMAAYYFVLFVLRAYLIVSYKNRNVKSEYICYKNTALLLLLLNIPMGVMIILMIHTNSGFNYPGYVIYFSAFYTLYIFVLSVKNLLKFRTLGSPILSASKVINLVAAMMSVLGLQTAMISHFSENVESYRKTMNTLTGSVIYGIVIIIAVYMLFHSRTLKNNKQ